MKAKIYRTLERFNDDNSGTFEAIALIGFFFMIRLVPETKGKSLEELEKELAR